MVNDRLDLQQSVDLGSHHIRQHHPLDVNCCPSPGSQMPHGWINSIPPSGEMPRFMTPRRPRVLPHENILHVTNPARLVGDS